MPSISDFVSALWGGGEKPTPPAEVEPAPPLRSYPTDADAAIAQQYGFGYGRGIEPYVNQEVSRVLGQAQQVGKPTNSAMFQPRPAYEMVGKNPDPTNITNPHQSTNLDLTDPRNAMVRAALGNEYAKAALAANRIPIASLGFDPSVMVADTAAGKGVNIGGLYSPSNDSIYFNSSYPGVAVHESIHRGIQKLRDAYPEEAGKILRSLPDEEYIVRYLNKTQGGDPERSYTSEKYRAIVDSMPHWQKEIDRLQEMAHQLRAKNRPRGPN